MGAVVADAPDFIFHKGLVAQQESCFYTAKDAKWKFSGEASFKDMTIGVVKDYRYGEPLDKFLEKNAGSPNITVITGVDTTTKLRDVLLAKRVITFAEDKSVMDYLQLSDTNPESAAKWKETKRVGCQKSLPLHVAFSPKKPNSKKLLAIFEKGIAELKANGKLATIRDKYLKSKK